jgi:peptide/nickel transport system substrate-binding protein
MMKGTDVRGRVGWDLITDIETPDANTAIFKFKSVDAGFLARLSLVQMLPEHILAGKTAEQLNKDPWFRAPVGTGPFKFKEWVAGDHITLVKNPDYFEPGKPVLDTIIWKVIPDSNVVLNQLQTGDIDLALRVSNTDAATMDTFQNVTRVSSSSVTPWLIWLNNTVPGLNDKAVRQALFYGTDREGMAKNLLKGLVQPADSLIPPYSWAYSTDVTTYKYDPEKAKQILDAAGWKPGADGIRAKGDVKLSFKISNIPGEQERVQVLSTAIAQWKQIGIDAQIDSVDVAAMWGNLLPKRT